MSSLFKEEIHDWMSWGKVFQSAEAFEPLIKYMFKVHNLPFSSVEYCTPGTNAVFKVGGYIVKIFAPDESGMDTDSDYQTELYGLERANKLDIPSPLLTAKGSVNAKYHFNYMVMEYINGEEFGKIESTFSDRIKFEIGGKLRKITDKLNTGCGNFNGVDVINDKGRYKRWGGFCDEFKNERLDYLKNHNFGKNVFVHGDLNPDNVLVGRDNELYIIDFADAVSAPQEYELAAVICELFCFEKPYMNGYFGEFDANELTERCFNGLIIHDFGGDIIRSNLGATAEITSLKLLKERLYTAISSGRHFEEN